MGWLAWFDDPGHQIIAILGALMVIGMARLQRFWLDWQAFQQWREALRETGEVPPSLVPALLGAENKATGEQTPSAPAAVTTDRAGEALPGAGRALRCPPDFMSTCTALKTVAPNGRYRFPVGWHLNKRGQPSLICGMFVNDTNNMLLTAMSDGGKDNLAWCICGSLATLHSPDEVVFAFLDGKGLDFYPWANKAHTWGLATAPEEIVPLMRAITAERERRRQILMRAGVSKWEAYEGKDLPLLVVFISEVNLLETAARQAKMDLDQWMNSELASGRAFGIRYLVGTQNASGQSTIWRSQISVFMAGFQPLDDNQVRPNTGRTPKQIIEAGAIPPNRLPRPPIGAGVFTLIAGDMVATVRAPLLTDEERRQLVKRLPDKVVMPRDEPRDEPPKLTLLPANDGNDGNESTTKVSNLPSVSSASALVLEEWLAREPLEPGVENGETSGDAGAKKVSPLKTDFSASGPVVSIFDLPFSAQQLVEITGRICAGGKRTPVVKSMPGYHTTKHREFSGYYDTIYTWLGQKGLLKADVGERQLEQSATSELMAS